MEENDSLTHSTHTHSLAHFKTVKEATEVFKGWKGDSEIF